jgi:hypothetical protein
LENLCIGIDIGAGLGVKMGLFTDPQRQIEDELLRRDECGTTSSVSWRPFFPGLTTS